MRTDPQFRLLADQLETLIATSADARHMALRCAVSLYDDAVRTRVRQGERIRDIVHRHGATEGTVDDVDLLLAAARSSATIVPVPLFGTIYAAACMEEERAAALVELVVGGHVAWPWLSGISGIGPVLAGRLLSRLDIRRAAFPSSFWSYCGLATVVGMQYRCRACSQRISAPVGVHQMPPHRRPDGKPCMLTTADPLHGSETRVAQPRPRRGQSRPYDASARHACYLIGTSFARRGMAYKAIYAEQLQRIEARHPEWPPRRVQLAAQRLTVKTFLVDLWVEWRDGEDRRIEDCSG